MFSPWQICSWPVWYFLAYGTMTQTNSTFIYFAQPVPAPVQTIVFKSNIYICGINLIMFSRVTDNKQAFLKNLNRTRGKRKTH